MSSLADPAGEHANLVETVLPGLAAAQAIRDALAAAGSTPTGAATLGVVSVAGQLPASAVAELGPVLAAAARAGHRVSAGVDDPASGGSLTVVWTRTGRADVDVQRPNALAGANVGSDLQRAADRGDADAALGLLPGTVLDVELTVTPPPDAGVWAPTVSAITHPLQDGRWAGTVLRLARTGLVVVQEAGSDVLRCPGLVVAGPDASPHAVRTALRADADLSGPFRAAGARAGYPALPVPGDLLAGPDDAGTLEPLRPALAAAAAACAWYWLGRASTVTPDGATTLFEGARPVPLALRPALGTDGHAEAALFAWATAAADPLRDDAVHQAVSLAVRDQTDLQGAAVHVLRTARSLHELAGRGVVAEALAARRAARDAAVTAARAAATAGREVATKAVERALALLIAVAVALFANGRNLLGTEAAAVIVAAAAGLALAALTVALRVEVPSGRALLDAFAEDAELYREALGEDDLAAVRNLAASREARVDLRRARKAALWVYLSAAAVIITAGIAALAADEDAAADPADPKPSPGASPTAAPPAASPVRSPAAPATPTQPAPARPTAGQVRVPSPPTVSVAPTR